MTGRTEDARPVSEAVRAVVAPAISRVTTHYQCNGMRADPPARPFAIPSGRETGVQHHSIVLYNTTKWKQNKMSLVNPFPHTAHFFFQRKHKKMVISATSPRRRILRRHPSTPFPEITGKGTMVNPFANNIPAAPRLTILPFMNYGKFLSRHAISYQDPGRFARDQRERRPASFRSS